MCVFSYMLTKVQNQNTFLKMLFTEMNLKAKPIS